MATPLTNFITCDECRQVYDQAKQAFTRQSEVDPDIEETGLQCPACGAEVIAYRTNGRIRELQAEVAKERERFRIKMAKGFRVHIAERGLKKALKVLKTEFVKLNPGANIQ